MANKRQFIETKPEFRDLVELSNRLNECVRMVGSLADGNDTPQRATDLLFCIQETTRFAKNLLTEESDVGFSGD
jgi:hypothetical protein